MASYSINNLFTPKNIIIYLVVAVILYGAVYYFFIRKNGTSYNYNSNTNYSPPAQSQRSASPSAAGNSMVVTLAAEQNSGESGTATLTEVGSKTQVVLNLTGAPADIAQPAHIHTGTCPGVGAVQYPLTSVTNGKSQTTLDVSIEQLRSQLPLAINVHKSGTEATVYVACGPLK